jgi:hypothetical protein
MRTDLRKREITRWLIASQLALVFLPAISGNVGCTLADTASGIVTPQVSPEASPETPPKVSPKISPEPSAVSSQTQVKQPLQGYAKQDSKGTPAIPEWKLKAGYDEVLGIFYVMLLGFKVHAANGPNGAAILGKSKLEHWKGHKPHPCLLKFTKLTDDSGGYYFKTIGSEEGPRGWIMPQPQEPHKPREWAIYFMQ